MKLAHVLTDSELTQFFGAEPRVDDCREMREFFGTQTFAVKDESIQFELSLDPYTPKATIELLSSARVILSLGLTVKAGTIRADGFARELVLEAEEGFSVILSLPGLQVKIVHHS